MKLSMIVAAAHNGVIGNNNDMPWYLPEDLKYFKAKTIGKPVIMGRKTYDAIGKPLPNRTNIVVTRNRQLKIPGVEIASSVKEALGLAEKACSKMSADEAMVIGGEQLYRLMLHHADRVYLTEVDLAVEGDTFFPALDPSQWREVSQSFPEKATGEVNCCFKILEKQLSSQSG